MPSARIIALTALAAIGVSCRSGPPPAIDSALAACVPPAATILAGVNLERVRASPLHQRIPPAALVLLESLGTAHSVLIASDGSNYLLLSRGDFRQATPGTTLLARGLAAAGSPDWVRAAALRQGTENGLLARAGPLAASAEIWIVAAGNANLPVSGNGENLNRLLHSTEYTTLTIRLRDSVALEAVGMCRGPELAQHLEETVRAILTLGAAGARRQPAVAAMLRRIRVSREGRTVRINLMTQVDELGPLLGMF